jgi:hypothetical protein
MFVVVAIWNLSAVRIGAAKQAVAKSRAANHSRIPNSFRIASQLQADARPSQIILLIKH